MIIFPFSFLQIWFSFGETLLQFYGCMFRLVQLFLFNLAILLFAAINLSLASAIWRSKLNDFCSSSDLWSIYCYICYCSYDCNRFSNLAISRSFGSGSDLNFVNFTSFFVSSGWVIASFLGVILRLKRPTFVPLCLGDNVI